MHPHRPASIPQRLARTGRHARARLSLALAVELLAVLLLAALFVPWGSLLARVRDDERPPRELAYALLTGDVSDSPWEIAAFDEVRGEVVARVSTASQPMLLPHPSGEQVYLVGSDGEQLAGYRPVQGKQKLTISSDCSAMTPDE